MGTVSPQFVEAWFDACAALPIAAIVTDAAGVVTHWSAHAKTLYGFEATEAVGTPIQELTVGPSQAAVAAEIMTQLGAGESWEGEFEATRRDGTGIGVHVLDLPVLDAAGALVGIIGLSLDVSAARRELRDATTRARELTARVDASRELERARIAAEIHDELGQLTTTLLTDLFWLEDHVNAEAAGRVTDMTHRAEALLASVRRICADLRPQGLEELGLLASVERLTRTLRERTGIEATTVLCPELDALEPAVGAEVYRILQESLTNIERHADATRVMLECRRDGDTWQLTIADDGRGADAAEPGFGIRSMRERAARLGGTLAVTVAAHGGTTVTATFPGTLFERQAAPACP